MYTNKLLLKCVKEHDWEALYVKFIKIINVDFTVFFYQPSYVAPLIQEHSQRYLASYEKINWYPMILCACACVCVCVYLMEKQSIYLNRFCKTAHASWCRSNIENNQNICNTQICVAQGHDHHKKITMKAVAYILIC